MNISSRIDKLENLISSETESVLLDTGEVVKVTEAQALELIAESVAYAAVVDENGKVDKGHRQEIELSELAAKVKQARSGQSKFIDTVKSMLGGGIDE